MKKRIPIFVAFALGALVFTLYWKISSPRFILENSTSFTLYSINPGLNIQLDNNRSRSQNSEKFCGEVVLGKTVISDPTLRQQLIGALYQSINESKGMEALCFDPRHGIHAKWLGQTVDVLICFHCMQANFCSSRCEHASLTNSAQPLFNKVLDDAKIPRSKPLR